MSAALIASLEAKGFQIENTGGNCQALVRSNPNDTTDVITATAGHLPAPDDWLLCRYEGDWLASADAVIIDNIDHETSPVDLLRAVDFLGPVCMEHTDTGRGVCADCGQPMKGSPYA